MTDASHLLRGILLGLSIAMPVGPIGVLCIRRTLAEGRLVGFVSGLGAATADAIYGAIAGFGLVAVTSILVDGQAWLRLGGGMFLVYLGVQTFRTPPAERVPMVEPPEGPFDAARAAGRTVAGGRPAADPALLLTAYASTLLLTLANPATILSFVGIFAGLGLADGSGGELADALLLVAGVFVGSALWWLVLSGGVGLLRDRLDARALQAVNRLSGAILALLGLAALASLLA